MIAITRGDTDRIQVNFSCKAYYQEGKKLTLTVRTAKGEHKVISKEVSYPENTFTIEHTDTKDLAYDKYIYDIQLSNEDMTRVKTLIVDYFVLNREVTF